MQQAMIEAVRRNNIEDVLQLLLTRQANVLDTNNDGTTAMSIAKKLCHTELYKLLLMAIPPQKRTVEQWIDLDGLRCGQSILQLEGYHQQQNIPSSEQVKPGVLFSSVGTPSYLKRHEVSPVRYRDAVELHPNSAAKYKAVMQQIDIISDQIAELRTLESTMTPDVYIKRMSELNKTIIELHDEAAAFCAGMDDATLMTLTQTNVPVHTKPAQEPIVPPLIPPSSTLSV